MVEGFSVGARRAACRGIKAIAAGELGSDRRDRGAWPLRRVKAGGVGDRAHKLADLLECGSQPELYEKLISHWPHGVVLGADSPPTAPLTSGYSFTEQMMLRDTVGYLSDDILVKVDRAAMATSLETRVPMFYRRLSLRMVPPDRTEGSGRPRQTRSALLFWPGTCQRTCSNAPRWASPFRSTPGSEDRCGSGRGSPDL